MPNYPLRAAVAAVILIALANLGIYILNGLHI